MRRCVLLVPHGISLLPAVFVSRRRQRTAPGRVRLPKESAAGGPLHENTTGMPVGGVEEGRRGFLGFGRRAGRAMPLNPLSALRPREAPPGEDRVTARFLRAVELLSGKRRGRGEQLTMQLTAEQQHDIVSRYAQTRWYGPLWRPFRNVTERQFKWWRRFTSLALCVTVLLGFGLSLTLYYREVQTVLLLDPSDRRDYQHIVEGMRYSEFFNLAMEVLRSEDPLEALPPPARYKLVLDAARAKGWHKVDWALEARQRYPNSVWDDMDYIHVFYWTVMYIGAAFSGGSEIFSDRLGNLSEVRGEQRRRDVEAEFVEQGPAPAQPKQRIL